MRIPLAVALAFEVNRKVAELESDLNIGGLPEYLLPFAEINLNIQRFKQSKVTLWQKFTFAGNLCFLLSQI